jgi:hypothetical protein
MKKSKKSKTSQTPQTAEKPTQFQWNNDQFLEALIPGRRKWVIPQKPYKLIKNLYPQGEYPGENQDDW